MLITTNQPHSPTVDVIKKVDGPEMALTMVTKNFFFPYQITLVLAKSFSLHSVNELIYFILGDERARAKRCPQMCVMNVRL